MQNFFTPLIREEKREIFSNNIDLDEDNIILNLEKSQTVLLNKLKDFNKYHNKVIELKKEKDTLSILLKKLKGKRNIHDFSKEEKNILSNKINSKKNKYSQNNQDIGNSLLNSLDGNDSILSDIMNDTINSEYEDEDNIEFISLSKNYKPLILTQNLKNKIPKINLEQIEFNKMKFKQEDAEKSLSRELKNFDEIDLKKELIKSKIKKEKAKNKKLNIKLMNLSQKINMMKKIINSMELNNYKISHSSIRDKKVGINVGRQFNALSGRNREIMDLKLNYGKGFNLNNEKNSEGKNEIIINDKDS